MTDEGDEGLDGFENAPYGGPSEEERAIRRRFERAMKRSKRQLAVRLIRAGTMLNAIDREHRKRRAQLEPFERDEETTREYRAMKPFLSPFWRNGTRAILERRRAAVVELTDAVVYAWEAGYERNEIQAVVRRVIPSYNFHVSPTLLGDDEGRFFRLQRGGSSS